MAKHLRRVEAVGLEERQQPLGRRCRSERTHVDLKSDVYLLFMTRKRQLTVNNNALGPPEPNTPTQRQPRKQCKVGVLGSAIGMGTSDLEARQTQSRKPECGSGDSWDSRRADTKRRKENQPKWSKQKPMQVLRRTISDLDSELEPVPAFARDSDEQMPSSTQDASDCGEQVPPFSEPSAAPVRIMQKVRKFIRHHVRSSFGRRRPRKFCIEAELSPMFFGPSLDEPFVTLLDHLYISMRWLFLEPVANAQASRV